MLDIQRFRAEYGGDPEVVRESQRRRGADEKLVDAVVEADKVWRAAQHTLQHVRGDLSQAKAAAHAARTERPDEAAQQLEQVRLLTAAAASAVESEAGAQARVHGALLGIGNLVHEHAPLCGDADGEAIRGHEAAAAAPATSKRGERERAALPPLVKSLVSAELAEPCGGGSWRPTGRGLLLREQATSLALSHLAERGYSLLAMPMHTPSARLQRLAKMGVRLAGASPLPPPPPPPPPHEKKQQQHEEEQQRYDHRGPVVDCAWDVLASRHGGEWLQQQHLPLRYATLRPVGSLDDGGGGSGSDGSGGDGGECGGGVEVCVCEVWPDDGGSWEALEALVELSVELHGRLGIGARCSAREVAAPQLRHAEARAFRLVAEPATPQTPPQAQTPVNASSATASDATVAAPDATAARSTPSVSVELGRVASHVDFESRRLEVRCGAKQLLSRTKRYVHVLHATVLRPTSCLLALAAVAPDALRDSDGCTWPGGS